MRCQEICRQTIRNTPGEFLVMGYKQTAFTEAFHICFVITLSLQYLVACVFSNHIFLIRS